MKRKGFNFVVKSKKSTTEPTDNNKGTQDEIPVAGIPLSDTKVDSDNNVKRKDVVTPLKLHYPKVVVPLDDAMVENSSKSTLINYLHASCGLEKKALQDLLSNTEIKDKSISQDLLKILSNVLDELETTVNDVCPDDINFQPETKTKEKQQSYKKLKTLRTQYESYVQSSEVMTQYENRLDTLIQLSNTAKISTDFKCPSIDMSDQYIATLESIQDECDRILDTFSSYDDSVTKLSSTQAELYNTFNDSNSIGPKETQSILKALQKL